MKNVIDKPNRDACPSEININRYILHNCSFKERKEIEDHLTRCPLCRMEVVTFSQVQSEMEEQEKWEECPAKIYNQSMSFIKRMVGPQESRLDICLRFIREQWELFRYTGTLIPQPALALREDGCGEDEVISTVIKDFGGYRAEVDLKKGSNGTVDIQIRVIKDQEEALVPHVIFTLKDNLKQRILEEATRDGEIAFEKLKPGEYSIEISCQENSIGNIFLDLRK